MSRLLGRVQNWTKQESTHICFLFLRASKIKAQLHKMESPDQWQQWGESRCKDFWEKASSKLKRQRSPLYRCPNAEPRRAQSQEAQCSPRWGRACNHCNPRLTPLAPSSEPTLRKIKGSPEETGVPQIKPFILASGTSSM